MKHTVTSRDGVEFVVHSDERSVAFDRAFASRLLAADLERHGDFVRRAVPAQVLAQATATISYSVDLDALLAPAPCERPKLRLIQGGKS